MLARGTKIFVAPGEHGFSFFQVKMFTGSVSVLLTSTSLKISSHYFFSSELFANSTELRFAFVLKWSASPNFVLLFVVVVFGVDI